MPLVRVVAVILKNGPGRIRNTQAARCSNNYELLLTHEQSGETTLLIPVARISREVKPMDVPSHTWLIFIWAVASEQFTI